MRDQAAGAGELAGAVLGVEQRGLLHLEGGQRRPQQGQRMALQRQPQRAIVGQHRIAQAGGLELRVRLLEGARGLEQGGGAGVDAGHRPDRVAPLAGQARQRIGGGQALHGLRVEIGAARQVFHVGERRLRTRGHDASAFVRAQAADPVQSQPHGALAARNGAFGTRGHGLVRRQRLERGVPVADRDVHRPHHDPVRAGVTHELGRCVETHRQAVEERGQERIGMMALDPCADEHQLREAGRVTLRKAIFAETLNLLEDGLGVLRIVVAGHHAADQLLPERLQSALALPGRHPASQRVCLARREVGREDSQLHHLFLEDRHAQRALQRLLGLLAGIDDGLLLLAALQVWMHHAALDRPRTHDRHLHHQVVELLRLQARKHAHLRAAFHLEHAHRIAGGKHLIDPIVVLGDVREARLAGKSAEVCGDAHLRRRAGAGEGPRGQRDAGRAVALVAHRRALRALPRLGLLAPLVLDEPVRRWRPRHQLAHLGIDEHQSAPQRAEHAQREDVDLEQLQDVEIVLVPLDDRALVHGGVLHRHQQRHVVARDDEAARMLAQVAGLVAQLQAQRDPLQAQAGLGIEAMFFQRQREALGRVAGCR